MSSGNLQSRLNKFNQPSLVEWKHLKFLIMDSPSELNIDQYVKEIARHGTTDVVRACEPHYPAGIVKSAGIGMHDYEFSDGDPPPPDIINKWLDLVEQRFKFIKPRSGEDASDACIAVHCVAGLGRAPMLVAVALIEAGLDPFDAVQFIRKKRRGAINDKQFRFLEAYKPTRRGAAACCCVVS